MTRCLTFIDLFSGCGGLSLGLRSSGFTARLAVEKSDMAAETYYDNFIQRISSEDEWRAYSGEGAQIEAQAEKGLVVKEIAALLQAETVMGGLEAAQIDLVAGGPPCQGFSMAGRRNPEDIRNQLPWQFLEFVQKVRPRAVIIENVSGMRHHFLKHGKKSPFEELGEQLSRTGPGYVVQPMLLNARHFGVPQNRPRVFLVAISVDVAEALGEAGIPAEPTVVPIWDSGSDLPGAAQARRRPPLVPPRSHFPAVGAGRRVVERTVASALFGLSKLGAADAERYRLELSSLEKSLAPGRGGAVANQRVRKHSDLVRERFKFYQFAAKHGIPKEILSLPRREALTAAEVDHLVRTMVSNRVAFPTALPGEAELRDAGAFVSLVRRLATKKHSQRALKADEPAPTVVSLPDDFVHPVEFRVPTVRELARFQSFPDAFEFRSKETTGAHRRRYEVPQYTQVGNAVPPLLAQALGCHVHAILARASEKVAQRVEAVA